MLSRHLHITEDGLRDYGTASWEGGDPKCDHKPKFKKSVSATVGNDVKDIGKIYYRDVCKKCGATRVDKQIGIEKTPEEYVQNLVEVFREVRRVLTPDGTLWLNLGDSYAGGGRGKYAKEGTVQFKAIQAGVEYGEPTGKLEGYKPKDMIGIPWMTAFALRSDGWWLRQDIIWCLSGGTWLYVKGQKGEFLMMVRELERYDLNTLKVWNGNKWTNIKGLIKSKRKSDEIEIVLRSGERISCSQNHKFPTEKGLIEAKDIKIGDTLLSCILPEPENPEISIIDNDAAWFAGLYLAEGSMSKDCINISGHVKEKERLLKLERIVKKFGGSLSKTISGNSMNIRISSRILKAILDELVGGRIAKDKHFSMNVWKYSNEFIDNYLQGYLEGDGHWEEKNKRWRLGFTRNYGLERDLRTACARLGYKLKLTLSEVKYNGGFNPTFRGELRKEKSGHFNEKNMNDVIKINKARCRFLYDIAVEDDPHLFSLASGILTHNSKPGCMPESVTDRCTKAHEYIFLLSKNQKYYFDYESIQERSTYFETDRRSINGPTTGGKSLSGIYTINKSGAYQKSGMRNKRSVWTVNLQPTPESHFAVFPQKLIEPMIKAGCPKGGLVLDPFMGSGTTGIVARKLERNFIGIELNPEYVKMAEKRIKTKLGIFL